MRRGRGRSIASRLTYIGIGVNLFEGHLARQHPAAGRDRPFDHVRRDGRHQHGAWRDDHARRLFRLRRAAGLSRLPAAAVVERLSGRRASRSPSPSPALVGIVLERTVIRFLYGRPLETLLATWGISLILQQAVRSIFGPDNQAVANPTWMTGGMPADRRLHPDLEPPGHHRLLLRRAGRARGLSALLELRPAHARGRAEPADGVGDGHPHRPGRRVHLRARLGHRRHRRRGALADRQCQPQSRPDLHRQLLPGGGVRRRRLALGHACGRLSLGVATKFLEPFAGAIVGQISCWSSSSCSSSAARAACSRSRGGRPRAEGAPSCPHRSLLARALPGSPLGRLTVLAVALLVRGGRADAERVRADGSALHLPDYIDAAASASICATRSWRWRSIWCGAIAACCRSATARSSRSADTRWACI